MIRYQSRRYSMWNNGKQCKIDNIYHVVTCWLHYITQIKLQNMHFFTCVLFGYSIYIKSRNTKRCLKLLAGRNAQNTTLGETR